MLKPTNLEIKLVDFANELGVLVQSVQMRRAILHEDVDIERHKSLQQTLFEY